MNYKYVDPTGSLVLLVSGNRIHTTPPGFTREDAIEVSNEEYRAILADLEAKNPPAPKSYAELEAELQLIKQKLGL